MIGNITHLRVRVRDFGCVFCCIIGGNLLWKGVGKFFVVYTLKCVFLCIFSTKELL